jgi:hypothetical protein
LTGISLWGVLGGASAASPTSPIYGAITTDTPTGFNNRNAILRYYVVATGSSGFQSVFSLGEINPDFGGTAPTPAFISFERSGALLSDLDLIAPGSPGRSVEDLVSLRLLSSPALPVGPRAVSTSIELAGLVNNPGTYTKSDLETEFSPTTVSVDTNTYTGVPLWSFLNPSSSNVTEGFVTVSATDGYQVVLALAELDPALGGNPQNLLPYADTGGDFPANGVARIVLPEDNRRGRWVSNVDEIAVEAVPEPATIAGTLIAGSLVAAYRKRRSRQS